MKADVFAELHLWNKSMDGLVRVLQRLEALNVCPKQRLRLNEVYLEEIRAALNADILAAILRQERIDHWRLHEQRSAWEQTPSEETTQQ